MRTLTMIAVFSAPVVEAFGAPTGAAPTSSSPSPPTYTALIEVSNKSMVFDECIGPIGAKVPDYCCIDPTGTGEGFESADFRAGYTDPKASCNTFWAPFGFGVTTYMGCDGGSPTYGENCAENWIQTFDQSTMAGPEDPATVDQCGKGCAIVYSGVGCYVITGAIEVGNYIKDRPVVSEGPYPVTGPDGTVTTYADYQEFADNFLLANPAFDDFIIYAYLPEEICPAKSVADARIDTLMPQLGVTDTTVAPTTTQLIEVPDRSMVYDECIAPIGAKVPDYCCVSPTPSGEGFEVGDFLGMANFSSYNCNTFWAPFGFGVTTYMGCDGGSPTYGENCADYWIQTFDESTMDPPTNVDSVDKCSAGCEIVYSGVGCYVITGATEVGNYINHRPVNVQGPYTVDMVTYANYTDFANRFLINSVFEQFILFAYLPDNYCPAE